MPDEEIRPRTVRGHGNEVSGDGEQRQCEGPCRGGARRRCRRSPAPLRPRPSPARSSAGSPRAPPRRLPRARRSDAPRILPQHDAGERADRARVAPGEKCVPAGAEREIGVWGKPERREPGEGREPRGMAQQRRLDGNREDRRARRRTPPCRDGSTRRVRRGNTPLPDSERPPSASIGTRTESPGRGEARSASTRAGCWPRPRRSGRRQRAAPRRPTEPSRELPPRGRCGRARRTRPPRRRPRRATPPRAAEGRRTRDSTASRART